MFKKKELKFILSHSTLIMFSLIIMLPLLWLLRVALTNKVTAYKLPPEWGDLNLLNFIDIFVKHPFLSYFANSIFIASASTFLALPLAAAMAYAFTRFNTGGTAMRLIVLSTQLLPPVIVVLPLFSIPLNTLIFV